MDNKVREYVSHCLRNGQTREQIYMALLKEGHTVNDVEKAFVGMRSNSEQAHEKADTQKRTIRIVVFVGAVLIGAGIFSFVAANWKEMTRPTKVGVILLAMILAHLFGWLLREKSKLEHTGTALIVLGSIIYGAGVFLTGQMFNIQQNWPDGFILWMFGVLAIAPLIRSYWLYYMAFVLGIIALVGHPFELFTFLFSGFNRLLMTSTFMLVIATIVIFITALKLRSRIATEEKNVW